MTDDPTGEPPAPVSDPWQEILEKENSLYRGVKLVAISGFISFFAIAMFVMLLYAGVGWWALLALCGLWVIPAFTLPGIRMLRSTQVKNGSL